MRPELLQVLRCPRTGSRLSIESPQYQNERIQSGWLVSAKGKHRFPIRNFVPRFVPTSNYADNFGMQWNKFRQTQLDSYSGQPISSNRFWKATGWRPEDLQGKWVLDVGCGSGRFAEVALRAGAKVVAIDYSSAVDACYENLQNHPDLHVVQADIYALPFLDAVFPFVYSLGVLQHTPDVGRAFAALPPLVTPGGSMCVDYYWKRIRTMLHMKHLLRPITTRMPQGKLFALLESSVPTLLKISQGVGRAPMVGRFLKRLVPVANYNGVYPLSGQQLREWALLDTFDMLAPRYDNPQTAHTAKRWFEQFGFHDVEVLHAGHLVARGFKPTHP